MDYGNYYYSSDTNVVGESDNSAVMMDSSLHRLPGGYVYNDLIPPEAGLGPVLDDEDPFGLSSISLLDLSGSEHLLTTSDSALYASRELQSVFRFEEPPSLLSTLRSSSSFSRSSGTPKSASGSCYKSPGLMGLGDDVLVIDGVLVKDEKGFGTQRQPSLFSAGKKLEPSLGSHRLRPLAGITDSPWYSGRRKSSGGGNCRADGRQCKKEKTAQGGKYKAEHLEEETNWSSQLPDQPFSRDALPCARALATEMWRIQLDNLKAPLETTPEDPWPPELPLLDRKQSSVGKVYETALRPWSLTYSSRNESSQSASQALSVPPPPPPPSGRGSSSICAVEQEPNSTGSLSDADEHWPKLSSTASKASVRRAWRRSNSPQPPPTPHERTVQTPVGSSCVAQDPSNTEVSQGRSAQYSPLEEPSNDEQPTSPGNHVGSPESIATEGSGIGVQPFRASATQQPPQQPPPTNVPLISYVTPEKQEPTKLMGCENKTVETWSPKIPLIDRNLTSGGSSIPNDHMETLETTPPNASSSSQMRSRAPKLSSLLQCPSQGLIGSCGTSSEQEPNELLVFEDKASETSPPEKAESSQSMPQDRTTVEEPSPEDPARPQLQQPPKQTPTGNSDSTAVMKKQDEPQGQADERSRATTPPNKYLLPNKPPVSSEVETLKIIAEEMRARRMWAHRAKELPPLQGRPFGDFPLTDGEEMFAHILMYGASRRRRLQVFEEICPSIPEQTRDSECKGSTSGSKK